MDVKASASGKVETQPAPENPKDKVGSKKAPMSVVPANVLAELGVAMLEGSLKYGRHNWRDAGIRSSVYYDACLRHLFAWWEGEDIDPDSGLSHITKAMATLLVLRDGQTAGMCEDDRPKPSNAFYPALNARASKLQNNRSDVTVMGCEGKSSHK